MISPLKTRYTSNASPSFSQAMKSTEKVTIFTLSSFEGICSNCPSSVILTNYNHLIHFQKTNIYIYIYIPCQRQLEFLHELKTLKSSMLYKRITITLLLVMNSNRAQAKIYVSSDKTTCNSYFNLKCSPFPDLYNLDHLKCTTPFFNDTIYAERRLNQHKISKFCNHCFVNCICRK